MPTPDPSDRQPPAVRGEFATTQWSLVGRAGGGAGDAKREAMTALVGRYLPALRSHLVGRKRIAADRADDLLQGFLACRVLEHDLIARAERNRGKFRTFLLTALDRYVANVGRHDRAAKRCPSTRAPLEDAAEAASPTAAAGDAFDAAWAREVIAHAIRCVRAECERSGRADVWGTFEARVLAPMLEGVTPPSNEQLAERFAVDSAARVSNLVVTGKRMFARALRSVVSEYEVGGEDEVEAEVAELQAALARSRA